jgi:site-specific DNA-methyltransferase (adenine-specific)
MTTAWDEALAWLQGKPDDCARAVIFDPPYVINRSTVRDREDGAAGRIYSPYSYCSQVLREIARVVMPGGIVEIFSDWGRMHDFAFIATTVGLHPAACVAWVRDRVGTGALFRSAWDPILVVSKGRPAVVDRAAIPNVVHAEHPHQREHPYEKPVEVYEHVLSRVCSKGDLVLDPFAGSGSSQRACDQLGCRWEGCDIDPLYTEAQAPQNPIWELTEDG